MTNDDDIKGVVLRVLRCIAPSRARRRRKQCVRLAAMLAVVAIGAGACGVEECPPNTRDEGGFCIREDAEAQTQPSGVIVTRPTQPARERPARPAPDASAADEATPDPAAPDDPAPDASTPDASAPNDAQKPPDASTSAAGSSPCPDGKAPPDYGLRCGCATLGKVLCSGACSVDDASCLPTGQYFSLSNKALGEGKVLDTYGGDAPNEAFIEPPCCSGSNWAITDLGDGYYQLTNLALGETRALESRADGSRLFMGMTNRSPLQSWKITGAGEGYFRIRNRSLGAGQSLETMDGANNVPQLNDTGEVPAQYWKITKI